MINLIAQKCFCFKKLFVIIVSFSNSSMDFTFNDLDLLINNNFEYLESGVQVFYKQTEELNKNFLNVNRNDTNVNTIFLSMNLFNTVLVLDKSGSFKNEIIE